MNIIHDLEQFVKENSTRVHYVKNTNRMPSSFWYFQGTGESKNSNLNAFDTALVAAGIGNVNLIQYSSIMPKDIGFQKGHINFPSGIEVGYILAKNNGTRGHLMSAGIAIAPLDDYFVVYEATLNGSELDLQTLLIDQIEEAIESRQQSVEQIYLNTYEMIVKSRFGCIISGLVFDPTTYR